MSSAGVREAVRDRLAALWTATEIEPDPDDLDSLLKDKRVPFVVPDFPGGFEETASVGAPGSNLFREDGTFQVHIFTPRGQGDAQVVAYAEAMRALFRGQDFDGVVCEGADPPLLDRIGNWLRATVAVDYTFDIEG